jgi:hypothetical protein
MTRWRVRATDKLWDQTEYERVYNAHIADKPGELGYRLLPQSLGSIESVNKLTPKEGDEVMYVYNIHPKNKQTEYKYIMRGIVRSGIIIGDRHKVFPGNIGNVRPHTERNEYIEIEITEVGLYDETEWSWTKNTSKRRTWTELI